MPRLLVIDDDDQFRSYVVKLLRRRGFDVSDINSGVTALDLLKANTYDAIITDIVMPDMEGLETIRLINRDCGASRVIAMSGGGSGTIDYLRYAQKLGATATIRKPFSPTEILDLLEKVLAA